MQATEHKNEKIEAFLIELGLPHVKSAFVGGGNPTPTQVAREIGSAIIQIYLGLATPVEAGEIDGHLPTIRIEDV